MKKSDGTGIVLIPGNDGALQSSFVKGDFSIAIKRFEDNSSNVPIPRLYDAYCWLKEQIDLSGPDSVSASNRFNDVFLRILEERGESGSEIYRSVLRDSSEYKLLNGVFGLKKDDKLPPKTETVQTEELSEDNNAKMSLKTIVYSNKTSLNVYSKSEWDALVDEYFISIEEEGILVKNSGQLLNRIIKRGDSEDYHIESIITYIFGRLLGYDELKTGTKEFAMKTLNYLSGKRDSWNRFHKQYLEIISK